MSSAASGMIAPLPSFQIGVLRGRRTHGAGCRARVDRDPDAGIGKDPPDVVFHRQSAGTGADVALKQAAPLKPARTICATTASSRPADSGPIAMRFVL